MYKLGVCVIIILYLVLQFGKSLFLQFIEFRIIEYSLCNCNIICYFQNLERLSLEYWQDISEKGLEKFCEAMSHITKLNLSQRAASHRYDGVLRAIAGNMPHLKYLDISSITVEPKFIEYLLPTEDNPLGGCKELAYLNLCQVKEVDVMLLKKIILALPKLNCLRHELVVNALGDLTEEEMGVDTGRSLNSLYVTIVYERSATRYCRNRLQVLARSPIFKRFNNITTLDVELRQQESGSLSDVLRSLQLRRVTLRGVPTGHKLPHLLSLSLLQSISADVQCLTFTDLSGDMSLIDIMRSFKHLVKLKLIHIHRTFEKDSTKNCSSTHHEPVETLSKLHVLNFLDEMLLHCLDENVCSADMLVALLRSPNINLINLLSVEAMTDDVMFNALSSPGGAALSTLTQLFVMECPLITAAPFVHWLTRENCSLQYLHICGCEKIDCNFLRDVAEQYPRALVVSERLDI